MHLILTQSLLCLLFLSSAVVSYAQQWDFLQKIEGVTSEAITDMGFTPEEDLMLTGVYEDKGGATFQSADGRNRIFSAEEDTFPYSHATLFLARYTPGGAIKWIVNAHAESGVHPWSLSVDRQGNSLLCGNFRGRAIFHDMDGQEQVLEGMRIAGKSPPLNAFVAKYSPEGRLLWLKLGLSAENSVAFEVATDAVGNAYVWAYCTYGAFTFGETTFLARNPAGRSFYNLGLILIKYGPDGQERWTLRGGNVDVKALHVSQEGAIELQGFLRDQALIWSSEGQMYDLPTPPRESRSPAKPCRFHFDTDGHLLAVKPDFPTLGDGTAHQYVRDSLGNYYALPQPSLASDPRGISYRLHWNGETRSTLRKDLFLAKFDSLQRPLWLIQFEGEYDELPLDITLDRKGNVLISGSYRNHILLKDAFKGEIELTSDYKTLFLASFSPEGQLQWATDAGNLFKDYNGHLHLRVDRKNHLFVGGGINAPSTLGKRQIEVLGPKGWVSPSWKKPIDYHSYPDAYVGCMLLESDEVEVVKNKKFKPSQKEDAAVPSPTELPKDLAYSADTLFARPATAATVSPEQRFNFRVFPNPVSQAQPDLQAEVNLPAPASITWQLVDSNGKVLLTKTQAYPAGTIVFPFSLSGYAAGVYLLRMETGGKRVVRRVVLW